MSEPPAPNEEPVPDQPPAPRPPRRRGLPAWVTVATLAGVLLAGAGVVYAAYRPERGIWVDELRADAERSLPQGSSREQAKEWFASHGITDVKDYRDIVGSGYKATLPNSTWMEDAQIIVTCMFDREDHLNRLNVTRVKVRRGGAEEPEVPPPGPTPPGMGPPGMGPPGMKGKK